MKMDTIVEEVGSAVTSIKSGQLQGPCEPLSVLLNRKLTRHR